ncbi:MAG: urate hydroxylase PuuD [PS1 clade bacterium]|jgi:uncharacterized membrane protein
MIRLYLLEWISLFLKFFHVIVGIAWIGASFYFNWLENKLKRVGNRDEIAGHLWAVHGGGFYYLEKYKQYPHELPEPLHWFKWEAYFTWISGFLLLTVVYYFNANSYLLLPGSEMSTYVAVLLSISGLILVWVVYDLLCKSVLVDRSAIFILVMLSFVSISAYLYSLVFNPMAVYMQLGAMLGTIMVANVFFVIIPVQKLLVKACQDRTQVSAELGTKGYVRSRHNNYFTLPVLFTMISGHYPIVYSSEYSWAVLIVVFVIAVIIRHYFNLKGVGQTKNSLIGLIIVSLVLLIFYLAPVKVDTTATESVSTEQVQKIINRRCASCHSASPTDDVFRVAPAGLALDTIEQIKVNIDRIYQNTVATQSMPFSNKTNMTIQERADISSWFYRLSNE